MSKSSFAWSSFCEASHIRHFTAYKSADLAELHFRADQKFFGCWDQ